MSTKIYYAWRCSPRVYAEEFLPKFREHCYEKITDRVKKLMAIVKPEIIKQIYDDKGWDKIQTYDEFLAEKDQLFRFRTIIKKAIKASQDYNRNPIFDLDCGINTWLYKSKMYIMPFGEHWIYNDFIPPEKAEHYLYWNNTDRPEEITEKRWENRGKTWQDVCLNDWNARLMVHRITDGKNTETFTPVSKKILPEKDAFSSIFFIEDMNDDLVEKAPDPDPIDEMDHI